MRNTASEPGLIPPYRNIGFYFYKRQFNLCFNINSDKINLTKINLEFRESSYVVAGVDAESLYM